MQLHPTSRSRRVRRLLAVSAAAVAVMIAPTACTYGGPGQMDMSNHSGHMDGMNMDEPQEPQVVPVANKVPATAAPAADDAARSGDDRRGGGRNRQTTSTTAPATTDPASATTDPAASASASDSVAPTTDASAAPAAPAAVNNGLEVLGRDCSNSKLKPHDGFQDSPACVSTAMGEIAAENQLPSLLITGAPRFVRVGQKFQLKVSTRNLVRDRFLGAGVGGYYLESSFLNAQGLQRGHFHTACRLLASTRSAPDSGKAPEFFVATQDGRGGAQPDTVTINVDPIKSPGVLQCTSWAGDGSHRTPMMTKANETPAIDSVRIFVVGRGQRVDNNTAADAALAPAATSAADAAAANADAAEQIQAEQKAAATQKPDGGVSADPAPVDAAAPTDPATSAEQPAATAETSAGN